MNYKINLEKVRAIRVDKNISLKTMAEVIGVETVATYQKKETGALRFNLLEAKKLASFFNTTIEELFFEEEDSEMESQE